MEAFDDFFQSLSTFYDSDDFEDSEESEGSQESEESEGSEGYEDSEESDVDEHLANLSLREKPGKNLSSE